MTYNDLEPISFDFYTLDQFPGENAMHLEIGTIRLGLDKLEEYQVVGDQLYHWWESLDGSKSSFNPNLDSFLDEQTEQKLAREEGLLDEGQDDTETTESYYSEEEID